METIDVLSKSFVVKWINVPDNCIMIFQAKPIKRSISLSVYKSHDPRQSHISTELDDPGKENVSSSTSTPLLARKRSSSTLSLSLKERISQSELSIVKNYGMINGNLIYKSELKIEKGGIYAFIFDNTSSKNYSKKILFNKFFVSNDSLLETRQQQGQPYQQLRSNSSTSLHLASHHLHPAEGQFLQGYLLKKKRKKLQGFTKRFFILNFKYNTLSYYQNESSLRMRGQMQINISTVSASKEDSTIVVDSGMDVWILKTLNGEDWDNWINALDFIKLNGYNPVDLFNNSPIGSPDLPPVQSPSSITNNKKNGSLLVNTNNITSKNKDEQLYLIYKQLNQLNSMNDVKSIHSQISEISQKIKGLMQQGQGNYTSKFESTPSTENDTNSIFSQDYFDAKEEANMDDNHVLMIETRGRHSSAISVDDISDDESINISKLQISGIREENVEDEDLYPLPIEVPIKRRNDIPSSTTEPLSLFSHLRKNIGKDMSTVSMPVTSNEPLTILQKIAECFEFSNLLNEASLEQNQDLKFLKIATFAISSLSAFRSKERNLRKPFNPILGETYEFINDQHKYRLIGEKISHRPQIFAFQLDSPHWEISFTLNPEQKFWGKSVEIINKGTLKLVLKKTGEIFEWSQPSTLLKNIISGDRYSEPANSSLTITSSIGLKAHVEFKKHSGGGLFSSQPRSEDVVITIGSIQDNHQKKKSDYYCSGKWTDSIYLKNFKNPSINEKIWTVSKLLPNEKLKWGFSEFTTQLNEISEFEKEVIPFMDSRCRPDIRNYESGNVDEAETLKLNIEQRQREERQRLAEANLEYKPNFFKKINDLEYEFIRTKGVNYWDRRKDQNWDGIKELW